MQGGLLDMKIFPSVGSHMELTNLLSGETYRARVVAIRRKEGQVLGVAVELLIPSETFWGVNFQLKRPVPSCYSLSMPSAPVASINAS